ncbi:hypothetical protein OSTOST_25143, partial [Ostertagia ostertagi]
MVIQQTDGTSTIQSFMAQCVHQKIHYNKQTLPRRIEEALEELAKACRYKAGAEGAITPSGDEGIFQLYQHFNMFLEIVVDEHHQHGPEVSEVDIGMPLAVQWKLIPES